MMNTDREFYEFSDSQAEWINLTRSITENTSKIVECYVGHRKLAYIHFMVIGKSLYWRYAGESSCYSVDSIPSGFIKEIKG